MKKIFNKEEGQSYTDKDLVNKILENKDKFTSFNIKLEKNENDGFYVKEIEKAIIENNTSANSSNNENKVISVGNLNLKIKAGSDFSDGVALVVNNNSEHFYIDKTGNKILEVENGGFDFSEGLTIVSKDIGNHIYKIGFMNKNGDIVIDCIYDNAYQFYDGLAPVEKDGKKGYIDTKGNWVLDSQSTIEPSYFSEGLATIFKDGKCGYIDKKGNIVIDCKYDTGSMFSEGLAWVDDGGKISFIDKQGNKVIDLSAKYGVDTKKDESGIPGVFSDGLSLINLNGKYKYIDKQGNIALEVPYEKVSPFSEGLAWAYKNGKYGFINKNGDVVIDFQYDSISGFSEGLALVVKNGKVGYINYDGTVIIGNI